MKKGRMEQSGAEELCPQVHNESARRTKVGKDRSTKPKRKNGAFAAGQILKIIHHRRAAAVTFNQSGRYG